jgi:hypothetical protein
MPFQNRVARQANAGTTLTYTNVPISGTLIVCYILSNSATPPVVTSGVTLTQAIYTAGHNGDYTGIYYLAPNNNPGGQTTITATNTPYALGYTEFTGCQWANPLVDTSSGGNNVAGTAATCVSPAAAQMQIYQAGYPISNAGSAFTDNYSHGAANCFNFGQSDWTEGHVDPTFTLGSSTTYDICMASFAGAPATPYKLQHNKRLDLRRRHRPQQPAPTLVVPLPTANVTVAGRAPAVQIYQPMTPYAEQARPWSTRVRSQTAQPTQQPPLIVSLPTAQVNVTGPAPQVQFPATVQLAVGSVTVNAPQPNVAITNPSFISSEQLRPWATRTRQQTWAKAPVPPPPPKIVNLTTGQVNVAAYNPGSWEGDWFDFQHGGAVGTSISFSPSSHGTMLLCYVVSNSASAPTVTGGGKTWTKAVYSPGHAGNYTGIFYLPGASNAGGISSVSAPGVYAIGYQEVLGAEAVPTYTTLATGWAGAGVTTWGITAPAGDSSSLSIYLLCPGGGGAPAATDSWGTPWGFASYGQSNFSLGDNNVSGSQTLGTNDACMIVIRGARTPITVPIIGAKINVAALPLSIDAGRGVSLPTANVAVAALNPSIYTFAMGGQGDPGQIVITYVEPSTEVLVGEYTKQGWVGPVSVRQPTTGLSVTEAWHSLGVGGSGNGVNGMFYRLTSENEVELIWDFAVIGVSGYIVATVPSKYIPTVGANLRSGWYGTGPNSYNSVYDPHLYVVPRNGSIVASGTVGLTTISMFGRGKYTLDGTL